MLGFPMSFFSPLFGWIPIWGMEAHHVYLLAPASKIHERGSPRRGTLQYSNGWRWPNVDGASSLSGTLLALHVYQVIQPLFCTFPTILFLPNLILYLQINKFSLANAVPTLNSLDPPGLDPGTLSLFTFMHWRRKWQPTPVFLPRESQGQGSLVGCRLWGHTESDTTEVT